MVRKPQPRKEYSYTLKISRMATPVDDCNKKHTNDWVLIGDQTYIQHENHQFKGKILQLADGKRTFMTIISEEMSKLGELDSLFRYLLFHIVSDSFVLYTRCNCMCPPSLYCFL